MINYTLHLILLAASIDVHARSYTFEYRDKSSLKVTVEAESKCAAYKQSAKICFNVLTGGSATRPGKYPGEEEGMDIIDICANPINFNP